MARNRFVVWSMYSVLHFVLPAVKVLQEDSLKVRLIAFDCPVVLGVLINDVWLIRNVVINSAEIVKVQVSLMLFVFRFQCDFLICFDLFVFLISNTVFWFCIKIISMYNLKGT